MVYESFAVMSMVFVVCGIVKYGKVWFGGNDDGKQAPAPALYSVTGRTLMQRIRRSLNTFCTLHYIG